MKFTVVVSCRVVSCRYAVKRACCAARMRWSVAATKRAEASKNTLDFCHLISFHFILCFCSHPFHPFRLSSIFCIYKNVPCVSWSFVLASTSALPPPFIKRNAKCRKGENNKQEGNVVGARCRRRLLLSIAVVAAAAAARQKRVE